GEMTPLSYAALGGDETVFQMLLERDTKRKGVTPQLLYSAMRANCAKCVDSIIDSVGQDGLSALLGRAALDLGDSVWVKLLIARGADVNAKGAEGDTVLMSAANSDTLPV